MSTCIVCQREVYKDNKCIFHIDKNDWYVDSFNNKIWDDDLVSNFWKEIRNSVIYTDEEEIDCSNFIFPIFELSDSRKQFLKPLKNLNYNECTPAPMDFNFWKKNMNVGFKKDISFLNAIFLDDASFSAISSIFQEGVGRPTIYKRISFQNAKFFGLADFKGINFKDIVDFRFFECNEVDFSGCSFHEYFTMDYSKIFKSFKISGRGIENISICNAEINNFNLDIDDKNYVSSFNYNPEKQKYNLELSGINFSGSICINDRSDGKYIKKLVIKDTKFSSASTLTLSNFDLETLELVNVVNLSSLITIRNIKIKDKLIFKNISFKNTEFIDFFANAKDCKIEINNTSILNSKLLNFEINSITEDSTNSSRAIYQQIKSAYDSQKDYINANKYYAKEMCSYQKEIFNSKLQDNLMDKIIFSFGKIVSNFSQNWFLALSWIILISLYFNFTYDKNIESINNGFIISFVGGFCLDILYNKKKNKNTYFILLIPLVYLITTYLNIYGLEFEAFSNLIKNTLPVKLTVSENFSISSIFHKIIFGLVFYQLIVSLRRQTKR